MSKGSVIRMIERWFGEHDDEGEFVRPLRASPYSVIGPSSSRGKIIYATKPKILAAAIENWGESGDFGMIGRYGLPTQADMLWVCRIVRGRNLLFLGDMDPADLMVFSWLRHHVRLRLTYLGVSDFFLDVLRSSTADSLSIPLAPSEHSALTLLAQVVPDLSITIGPKCLALLERGFKIELEAVVNAQQAPGQILRPATLLGET